MKTGIGEAAYILLNFIGRAVWWGAAFGALLGFLGGVFYSPSLLAFYGLIYGVLVGIFCSGIVGIVLGTTTSLFWRKPRSETAYYLVILITGIPATFTTSFLSTHVLLNFYAAMSNAPNIVVISVLIALVASCAGAYATLHIAKWYLQYKSAK